MNSSHSTLSASHTAHTAPCAISDMPNVQMAIHSAKHTAKSATHTGYSYTKAKHQGYAPGHQGQARRLTQCHGFARGRGCVCVHRVLLTRMRCVALSPSWSHFGPSSRRATSISACLLPCAFVFSQRPSVYCPAGCECSWLRDQRAHAVRDERGVCAGQDGLRTSAAPTTAPPTSASRMQPHMRPDHRRDCRGAAWSPACLRSGRNVATIGGLAPPSAALCALRPVA